MIQSVPSIPAHMVGDIGRAWRVDLEAVIAKNPRPVGNTNRPMATWIVDLKEARPFYIDVIGFGHDPEYGISSAVFDPNYPVKHDDLLHGNVPSLLSERFIAPYAAIMADKIVQRRVEQVVQDILDGLFDHHSAAQWRRRLGIKTGETNAAGQQATNGGKNTDKTACGIDLMLKDGPKFPPDMPPEVGAALALMMLTALRKKP